MTLKSRPGGFCLLGPVSPRILLQKSVKLINALPNAGYGGLRRAAAGRCSRAQFTRFEHLKLPLKLGAHLYPILNEVMDRSHAFDPML